jgi:hypothetical protein
MVVLVGVGQSCVVALHVLLLPREHTIAPALVPILAITILPSCLTS